MLVCSNSWLKGMGGSDSVNGGSGSDTLVLRGIEVDYTVTAAGAGWRIVDNVADRDGTTLITNVEQLIFYSV